MCSEAGSEGGSEGCAKVGIINIRMLYSLPLMLSARSVSSYGQIIKEIWFAFVISCST